MHKFRFICTNIWNIPQNTIHCIALWHIHILILSEIKLNILWYLQDTQLKTLRPEKESSETFTESGKEKNPSQRKFNLSLKEYINIRMVSIVETTIGFDFDRSQKSIRQETKTWKCKPETIWAYYDHGVWTDGNRKNQDDCRREKTNSWEGPILYYRNIKRVEWKKASQTRCLTFAPYAWRRFTPCGVMRCGRGLRTTHYIVRPRLTICAAKICSFS